MRARQWWKLGAGLLAVAVVAAGCSGSDDSSSETGDSGDASTAVNFGRLDGVFEEIPPGGGDNWYSFKDDFTAPESQLADFTKNGKSGTKGDGSYEISVPEPNDFIAISAAAGRSYRVTVQATVGSTGAANDAGYGVMCRRDDAGSFFYGGVGNDGTYAIGRVEQGARTVLTGNGSWVPSTAFEPGLEQYDVRLTCDREETTTGTGPIDLTLTVDGEQVDTVTAPDTNGNDAGVFVESFEDPDAVATFTSFLVATGGTVASSDYPESSHGYHVAVLNQPSTVGTCSVSEPEYFHVRFVPTFVAECEADSHLPGSKVVLFGYEGSSNSPESPVAQAKATYRVFLDRVGLEPAENKPVPNCGKAGTHQGKLVGLAEDNTLISDGAIACGQAKDGRTFVVSYVEDDKQGAVVAIATVPADQRAEFTKSWSRDFPGIPSGADSIAFDGES